MNRRNEPPRRIDQPEPGYFKVRLCRKGPWVGAEIRHNVNTGWKAFINGESCGFANQDYIVADGVNRIWTFGSTITAAEYKALMIKRPTSPDLPINPNAEPPPF